MRPKRKAGDPRPWHARQQIDEVTPKGSRQPDYIVHTRLGLVAFIIRNGVAIDTEPLCELMHSQSEGETLLTQTCAEGVHRWRVPLYTRHVSHLLPGL